MSTKQIFLTQHAKDVLAQRSIHRDWVEEAVQNPLWIMPDVRNPNVERRYRPIVENGGRVLRVVCYETALEVRILSAFFDRDARRPE